MYHSQCEPLRILSAYYPEFMVLSSIKLTRFLFRSQSNLFLVITIFMMTSSNGNSFRVSGHLCREFTGRQWIPLTQDSDAELWCFLWSAPEKNGWVYKRGADDLRRHRARYDVTVMCCIVFNENVIFLRVWVYSCAFFSVPLRIPVYVLLSVIWIFCFIYGYFSPVHGG